MTQEGKAGRVWPRRQERAARTRVAVVGAATRLLVDRGYAATTMADIALAAGFADLRHFNRTFRRRYGATPSEMRLAARRRDAD